MSQKTLADACSLSLPTVKNLETAKTAPRMNTVRTLAEGLDVRVRDLFTPVRELKAVRFRSGKSMRSRENILAEVSVWLENFNELEDLLNERVPFALNDLPANGSSGRSVEAAARCRNRLGLQNDEPVHDICGLLESAGVKVLPMPAASVGFFGLAVGIEDSGPAIVVNTWDRISVERQIFSAAHELAHILLHPGAFDVDRTADNKREEAEADRFAGHFLLPDEGFRKEWGESAGLRLVDRVFKVKRIFHVSYKTILVRLIEWRAADRSIWAKFNAAYRKQLGRKLPFKEEPLAMEHAEPFGLQRFDFSEDRFHRLIRKALETDTISITRGAEMLGISTEDMYERMREWSVVR